MCHKIMKPIKMYSHSHFLGLEIKIYSFTFKKKKPITFIHKRINCNGKNIV